MCAYNEKESEKIDTGNEILAIFVALKKYIKNVNTQLISEILFKPKY